MKHKDFSDITVKDITAKATVNRATFYAHFTDKYQLMDHTLTDVLWENLKKQLQCHDGFNRETLLKIIVIMCSFHEEVSGHFKRNYGSLAPHIESRINEALEEFFLAMILRNPGPLGSAPDAPSAPGPSDPAGKEKDKLVATLLSRSIYGMSHAWNKEGRKSSREEFASLAILALEEVGGLFAVPSPPVQQPV
ncbi:TetR/AcrR family transcriptional regulator [Paenibacillus sp. D51F]